MSNYRLLQLTNTGVGAVAANSFMPLGAITRKISCPRNFGTTFDVANTGANIVYLNEAGYYKITYNASLLPSAASPVTLSLIVNGTSVYTSTAETSATGDSVNITIPFVIRACPNCASTPDNIPVSVQLRIGSTAITGGTSNLVIERVYC